MAEPRLPLVFDLRALRSADAGTVDALARLQLTARRCGLELRLLHPPAGLVELVELAGLAEALPVEARREAEEREEPLGGEEERELRDPAVDEL